jgi:hypothetical protein
LILFENDKKFKEDSENQTGGLIMVWNDRLSFWALNHGSHFVNLDGNLIE